MSAHPLRVQRALRLHREQTERASESRRLARRERIRQYFVRRIWIDRLGWLFCVMSCGCAVGYLVERFV